MSGRFPDIDIGQKTTVPSFRHKKPKTKKLGLVILIAVFVTAGVLCFFAFDLTNTIAAPKEKRLVREWLEKNLDDPSWEEVEWDQVRGDKKKKRNWTIIGLKYRTKNQFDAKVLKSSVFVLFDGSDRVYLATSKNKYAWHYYRFFGISGGL